MADFVQTMKDWKRMCSAMEKLHPNDSCAGCRLEGYGCPAIYEDNSHVDYSNVEKSVTAWAAEHPEPRYPTWMEWLTEMGAIPKTISWDEPLVEAVYDALQERIPCGTAQMLGVESLPVEHGDCGVVSEESRERLGLQRKEG